MPDKKLTVRIPEDTAAKLEEFIAKMRASGRRGYSKNDALVDGLELLMSERKEPKKK